MKKILAASIVLISLCGIGCQSQSKGTDASQAADTTGQATTGTTAATDQIASATAVPANLQNDAYHYRGLNRRDSTTFAVSTLAPGATQPKEDSGGEVVKFLGMQDGKAKFSIERTGAMESLFGSDEVLLDDQGVTIQTSDSGDLNGHPIDLISKLTPGATWKTDYSVNLKKSAQLPDGGVSADHSVFKVVGPQKVKTKAGTFDAILVESLGNDTLNNQKLVLKTQSWYAKDRGAVKIVVTTSSSGRSETITIEAAPGDSK
jgi:hypothetical protein